MPPKARKNPTLIDMGKQLNLTPRAVSQALNGGDCSVRVSEKTRLRVLELAARLNYRPNRNAQTLRTGKSGMIGFLAAQGFNHLLSHHLWHARNLADNLGYHLNIYLMRAGKPQPAIGDQAVDFMLDSKVEGLVIFGNWSVHYRDQFQRFIDEGVPVVMV